jgi:hypothetical protein
VRASFLERAFKQIPHGGVASERRVAKSAFGGLTGREREVAGLIGETYVSSILAKLASRRERRSLPGLSSDT